MPAVFNCLFTVAATISVARVSNSEKEMSTTPAMLHKLIHTYTYTQAHKLAHTNVFEKVIAGDVRKSKNILFTISLTQTHTQTQTHTPIHTHRAKYEHKKAQLQ